MSNNPLPGGVALKDYQVIIPLSATILALCFSTGRFIPCGMNFIMFFSVSEHVASALGVLPFALILAVALSPSILFASFDKVSDPSSQATGWRSRFGQAFISLVVATFVILPAGFAYGFVWPTYVFFFTGAIALIIACIFLRKYRYVSPLAIVTICIFGALGAGAFSSFNAMVPPNDKFYEIGIDGTKHRGTVLFTGEKAILFFNPSDKRTHYYRIESIESISREGNSFLPPTGVGKIDQNAGKT
jgi:hypothetical protein